MTMTAIIGPPVIGAVAGVVWAYAQIASEHYEMMKRDTKSMTELPDKAKEYGWNGFLAGLVVMALLAWQSKKTDAAPTSVATFYN